jgi:septal ring factor EnvC (AmiA/AmiB activator)
MVENNSISEENKTSGLINLFKRNFKYIVQISFALFILYWVIFIMTPTTKMSEETSKKLDSLNLLIQKTSEEQKKLDSNIANFNKEIENIDNNISKIKTERTIIKEYYHEKINDVDNYTDDEIDSFFAVRYRYYAK